MAARLSSMSVVQASRVHLPNRSAPLPGLRVFACSALAHSTLLCESRTDRQRYPHPLPSRFSRLKKHYHLQCSVTRTESQLHAHRHILTRNDGKMYLHHWHAQSCSTQSLSRALVPTDTHIHTHTHTHTHTRTFVFTRVSLCEYAFTHKHTHEYCCLNPYPTTLAHIEITICNHVRFNTHTHTHTQIFIIAHLDTQWHNRTHTRTTNLNASHLSTLAGASCLKSNMRRHPAALTCACLAHGHPTGAF
jgi:hypothetical protein